MVIDFHNLKNYKKYRKAKSILEDDARIKDYLDGCWIFLNGATQTVLIVKNLVTWFIVNKANQRFVKDCALHYPTNLHMYILCSFFQLKSTSRYAMTNLSKIFRIL